MARLLCSGHRRIGRVRWKLKSVFKFRKQRSRPRLAMHSVQNSRRRDLRQSWSGIMGKVMIYFSTRRSRMRQCGDALSGRQTAMHYLHRRQRRTYGRHIPLFVVSPWRIFSDASHPPTYPLFRRILHTSQGDTTNSPIPPYVWGIRRMGYDVEPRQRRRQGDTTYGISYPAGEYDKKLTFITKIHTT